MLLMAAVTATSTLPKASAVQREDLDAANGIPLSGMGFWHYAMLNDDGLSAEVGGSKLVMHV
jgi:hypothetical protein